MLVVDFVVSNMLVTRRSAQRTLQTIEKLLTFMIDALILLVAPGSSSTRPAASLVSTTNAIGTSPPGISDRLGNVNQ